MKLIDLLSLLVNAWATGLDAYDTDDDDLDPCCIWTGVAADVPSELHDRIVESFDVSSSGLSVNLI